MKIEITQESLKQVLNLASRFVSIRPQLPVLSNIKLKASGNTLQIMSTDLEISFSTTIGVKVVEEGEVAVPGKNLAEIVSNLNQGNVDLKSENEKLSISSDGFEAEVPCMNTSDFPEISDKIKTKMWKVDSKLLFESLSEILFSVSTDETRAVLTGVYFMCDDNNIRLVSTDGFRLSQVVLDKINTKGDLFKTIIPKNVLSEAIKLGTSFDFVEFGYSEDEKLFLVKVDNIILTSRIIEGNFPDYEKIIPQNPTLKVDCDKEDLIKAVKLSSIFAKDSGNVVKLEFGKDNVDFKAEGGSSGKQKNKIEAKITGEPMNVVFNCKYLLDYLQTVSGNSVLMSISGETLPVLFTDPSEANLFHIIMPVKA